MVSRMCAAAVVIKAMVATAYSAVLRPTTLACVLPQRADDQMDAAQSELWFVRRRLEHGGTLGDYVGRNDKTRAAVRLCRAGTGTPARELVRPLQPANPFRAAHGYVESSL